MLDDLDENSTKLLSKIPLHISHENNFGDSIIEKGSVVVSQDDLECAIASKIFSQLVNPYGSCSQNFCVVIHPPTYASCRLSYKLVITFTKY